MMLSNSCCAKFRNALAPGQTFLRSAPALQDSSAPAFDPLAGQIRTAASGLEQPHWTPDPLTAQAHAQHLTAARAGAHSVAAKVHQAARRGNRMLPHDPPDSDWGNAMVRL